MRQLPVLERDILRVLVEQSKSLKSQDIAAWLNKSEKVLQNNPPRSLLKLGFVARSKNGNYYVYRAILADYLQREFPGADIQHLQSLLVKGF